MLSCDEVSRVRGKTPAEKQQLTHEENPEKETFEMVPEREGRGSAKEQRREFQAEERHM